MGINKGPKVQQHHIIMHQNRILTNLCQIRTKFNQILAKCLPETNNLTGFGKVPAVFGCHFPWHFLGISMELHATWCIPMRAWLFVSQCMHHRDAKHHGLIIAMNTAPAGAKLTMPRRRNRQVCVLGAEYKAPLHDMGWGTVMAIIHLHNTTQRDAWLCQIYIIFVLSKIYHMRTKSASLCSKKWYQMAIILKQITNKPDQFVWNAKQIWLRVFVVDLTGFDVILLYQIRGGT